MGPKWPGWSTSSWGSKRRQRRYRGRIASDRTSVTWDRVTRDTPTTDILDWGPKAGGASRAKMLAMNRPASNSSVTSPRRFLLLPEESVDGPSPGPRIRRYQLTSVGRRPGLNGIDIATARILRELDRPGRM